MTSICTEIPNVSLFIIPDSNQGNQLNQGNQINITSSKIMDSKFTSTMKQERQLENKGERLGCMRLDDQNLCKGCGMEIRERYFLRVFDQLWHENCLRCSSCEKPLSGSDSCYIKKDRVYCKEDHKMLFANKCARCHQILKSTDHCVQAYQSSNHLGSMASGSNPIPQLSKFTFHADCFQCLYCRRELQKGDRYYCVDGQLVCQGDYMQIFAGSSVFCCPPPIMQISIPTSLPILGEISYPSMTSHQMDSNTYYESRSSRDKKQPKRPRTILNASQRKSFKIAFEKSPKPSRKVREQLAKESGLSVRVVQVWMQNQRAKLKKEQRKRDTGSVKSNSITCSTDSDLKSIAEDELKSIEDSLDDDFDSEEYTETLSERSSNTTIVLPSLSASASSKLYGNESPINQLYQMQQKYFAYV